MIPRGWAVASLLAMIVFEKFGQHQPCGRPSAMHSRARRSRCRPWPTRSAPSAQRSIPSGASSRPMSWRASACTATTRPCRCGERQDRHRPALDLRPATTSRSAAPGSGANLPLLARSARRAPRRHIAATRHPTRRTPTTLQQALSGGPQARSDPEAGVWGACPASLLRHGRYRGERAPQGCRKSGHPLSPIAIEVARRIDALFAIERSINGKSPEERLAVRCAIGPGSTISWPISRATGGASAWAPP